MWPCHTDLLSSSLVCGGPSQLHLLLAFLGGVCPALLWLFFWLMEDRCQPEPKRFIFYSFAAGMFAVAPTLYLQWIAQASFGTMNLSLLAIWAIIEESMKFGAAYFVALRFSVYDEPLDAVIYLVTAALGFSALENILFLWSPISSGDLVGTLVLGESRFMGASLVHTLSSVTVGIALALSFYKPADTRKLYAFCGLILAALLHTTYNYFILTTTGSDVQRTQETFWIFVCVWLGIIVALLLTERLKKPNDYC